MQNDFLEQFLNEIGYEVYVVHITSSSAESNCYSIR